MSQMMDYTKMKLPSKTVYLVLLIFAVFCIYPLIWIAINSLKTNRELFDNPWGFARCLEWRNYGNAWITGNIGRYFLNSVLVVMPALSITIVISAMAAFSISRLQWKLSQPVLSFFLIGMMIPIHSTLIPLFMFFMKVNVLNTYFALIIPYAAFALPISVFILAGFFATIPKEMEEAAVMDGCSMGMAFWKIILPISKSALATVAVFDFVAMWNELIFALVFISDPQMMTLPVGLTNFAGRYTTDWTTMLAAMVMAIIPSIIVYIFLHDRIIAGMTSGAVKG